MTKSILITLCFGSMVLLSFAFTKDDPLYKNLKILPKNITKPQMDSIMHHYTASLNVRCNFCHVRNEEQKTMDYASDDNKHKLVARQMMKMTDKINKSYFDVTGDKSLNAQLLVTCYTCHHGATDPETKAPAREQNRPPRPQTDSTKSTQ